MRYITDQIRKLTPLALRKKIGPFIGYTVYWFRTRSPFKTWKPQVLSIQDTIDKINTEGLSIIRFGDGELSLISGHPLGFQKHNHNLETSLRTILGVKDSKLLVCIPGIFGRIEHFAPTAFWFEIHHLFRYAHLWRHVLSEDYVYGDAFITRPYLTFLDKNYAKKVFSKIKKLWEKKDTVLIEGEMSRLGVGNDLFEGTSSLKRILCPSEDAYNKKDEIVTEAKKLPKETLILLSLGPAAKVIAFELFTAGYRVLDIGHIDMEYEMFLRESEKIIPVEGKYFNEIDERNPKICTDTVYLSQIITKIV